MAFVDAYDERQSTFDKTPATPGHMAVDSGGHVWHPQADHLQIWTTKYVTVVHCTCSDIHQLAAFTSICFFTDCFPATESYFQMSPDKTSAGRQNLSIHASLLLVHFSGQYLHILIIGKHSWFRQQTCWLSLNSSIKWNLPFITETVALLIPIIKGIVLLRNNAHSISHRTSP